MEEKLVIIDTIPEEKLLFLETIYKRLTEFGFGDDGASFVTFLVACTTLVLLIWMLRLVFAKTFSYLVRMAMRNHRYAALDHFLRKRKVYRRFINFVAAFVLIATSQIIFSGFGIDWILWANRIINIYTTIVVLRLVMAILGTVNDVYETKPQAQFRSIRSLVQTVNIILSIIAAIVAIVILIGSSSDGVSGLPWLGAFAAVIALIFRDLILSFVASIQVSVQDMFRPGDWVEIPSRGANGRVEQINVMNIKVRNFDNSVSMVPTYVMISETFTNWRNMQESGGRRFMRPLLIENDSLVRVDEEWIERLAANEVVSPEFLAAALAEMKETTTAPFMTNLGLYRLYIEAYLRAHPKINQDHWRLVRYLDSSDFGIRMEVHAFSLEKMLYDYEHVIADVMEYTMTLAPVFGIRFFQRPSAQPRVVT